MGREDMTTREEAGRGMGQVRLGNAGSSNSLWGAVGVLVGGEGLVCSWRGWYKPVPLYALKHGIFNMTVGESLTPAITQEWVRYIGSRSGEYSK